MFKKFKDKGHEVMDYYSGLKNKLKSALTPSQIKRVGNAATRLYDCGVISSKELGAIDVAVMDKLARIQYLKIQFETRCKTRRTGAIVITNYQHENLTLSEKSALFPHSEAAKMERVLCGPSFDTFKEAFSHDFYGDIIH